MRFIPHPYWTRDVEENGVLATCEALGIGFVPFSPLGAVNIELTPDDLREIDAAASKIEVQGARLPEAVLRYSNR